MLTAQTMFHSIILALSFALVVFAQSISIGAPLHDTTLTAGQNFTIEVDRPVRRRLLRSHSGCLTSNEQNSITGSSEAGIVIALRACTSTPCSHMPSDKALGTVLYAGPYLPKLYAAFNPPHDNFSVYLPETFEKGTAQINVVHYALVGVSHSVD